MTSLKAETSGTTAELSAQSAAVAPEKTAGRKTAGSKKGASKSPKVAKGGKAKGGKSNKTVPAKIVNVPKAAKPKTEGAREGSKTTAILELLQRAKGATLAEIVEATSWQAHSVRGFISGTLGKKMRLSVNSEKREDGTRVYSIAK